MTEFDKKIKKLSKNFEVPKTYHEKVDEILATIQEEEVAVPKKNHTLKRLPLQRHFVCAPSMGAI